MSSVRLGPQARQNDTPSNRTPRERKDAMSIAWIPRYALRTRDIKSSAIRELLKITQRPEVISFAGGLPANDVSRPAASPP